MDVKQAVAVVTGASQGIGHATAVRLARDFSSIVLVARNRAKLEETAKAVETDGAEALILDIDLSDKDAAKKVVEQTLARFGRIDALLNIAGAVPQIDLFEMTDEQWEAGMALKLHGARRLRPAGRDRRPDGVSRVAGGAVDDGLDHPHGWRRGQVNLGDDAILRCRTQPEGLV
jgi:NAD(P)-dependent dehydrogenase (short-subunit alcohol dehydrogenase family)